LYRSGNEANSAFLNFFARPPAPFQRNLQRLRPMQTAGPRHPHRPKGIKSFFAAFFSKKSSAYTNGHK
jgi:hypothetical protein